MDSWAHVHYRLTSPRNRWDQDALWGEDRTWQCLGLTWGLDPTEQLWDVLYKQVWSRDVPPHSLQDLKNRLLTSWFQIPQPIHTINRAINIIARQTCASQFSVMWKKYVFMFIPAFYCNYIALVNVFLCFYTIVVMVFKNQTQPTKPCLLVRKSTPMIRRLFFHTCSTCSMRFRLQARAHTHTRVRSRSCAGAWSLEPPSTRPTWREKVMCFSITY